MSYADFVREYQNMVYTTSLRITGDVHDAEDIAQEVFLKAYLRFSDLQTHENPGGWLRTAARNLSINHIVRYRRKFLFIHPDDTFGEQNAFIDDPDESDEWLYEKTGQIKNALLGLPASYRVPLVLYYYENLEYKEIAKKLKVSLSKVKTDILRGKKKMKSSIQKMESADAKQ